MHWRFETIFFYYKIRFSSYYLRGFLFLYFLSSFFPSLFFFFLIVVLLSFVSLSFAPSIFLSYFLVFFISSFLNSSLFSFLSWFLSIFPYFFIAYIFHSIFLFESMKSVKNMHQFLVRVFFWTEPFSSVLLKPLFAFLESQTQQESTNIK